MDFRNDNSSLVESLGVVGGVGAVPGLQTQSLEQILSNGHCLSPSHDLQVVIAIFECAESGAHVGVEMANGAHPHLVGQESWSFPFVDAAGWGSSLRVDEVRGVAGRLALGVELPLTEMLLMWRRLHYLKVVVV